MYVRMFLRQYFFTEGTVLRYLMVWYVSLSKVHDNTLLLRLRKRDNWTQDGNPYHLNFYFLLFIFFFPSPLSDYHLLLPLEKKKLLHISLFLYDLVDCIDPTEAILLVKHPYKISIGINCTHGYLRTFVSSSGCMEAFGVFVFPISCAA